MRLDSSVIQTYNFGDKVLPFEREDSKLRKIPCKSWCRDCKILMRSTFLPVSLGTDPQEAGAIFSEFPKSSDDGLSEASRSSKTCPAVPNESYADQNKGARAESYGEADR